jgi:hypothetical protein
MLEAMPLRAPTTEISARSTESQEEVDLDRILVQSICQGELLSFVVVLELGLGLELVLVLASLLKTNLISLRCSSTPKARY